MLSKELLEGDWIVTVSWEEVDIEGGHCEKFSHNEPLVVDDDTDSLASHHHQEKPITTRSTIIIGLLSLTVDWEVAWHLRFTCCLRSSDRIGGEA